MEHQLRMSQNGDPSLGRRSFGGEHYWDKPGTEKWFKNDRVKYSACKRVWGGKKHMKWLRRHIRSIVFTFMLMVFLFLLDSLLSSVFNPTLFKNMQASRKSYDQEGRNTTYDDQAKNPVMYFRLLHMASVSLAEREIEQKESNFWKERYLQASLWKPWADNGSQVTRAVTLRNHTGYVLVSANGGLNQQRVAVCNAVAVASLLNATLVIPRFLYSNVWKDPSQFHDIYQEDTFMNTLKNNVNIVKELPSNLKSKDLKAIGSIVTDSDLSKEATPEEYTENILPILIRNGVVHFLGFGNRLGFNSMPSDVQKLRCKCNFHALKFVPRIQKIGSLLVKRIRKYESAKSLLDKALLGKYISSIPPRKQVAITSSSKYLALHLRFEVDMVAYSMCDFGGGEDEKRELQAYREEHFPILLERLKKLKQISPTELRITGRCPLTPEEAALVLAGLGFDSGTSVYLAGSKIYGGKSKMKSITGLYPNMVTKEDLLSPKELEPLRNFSSQLAALDFIACAASDVFSMTDSGSQLSSLVSGFRTYYGGRNAPILRPSKKSLASILRENNTISWHSFERRIRRMIEEGQRVVNNTCSGKSIYRHPRCNECMRKDQ
ncbi:O-fucosyltransferase 8-like isoform X1 [Primulina eburnea]|uniref:O-fucosyltransferase 8-like isoform X1 n=1 Tax=Primulina eburnea TaxID=1245227 RepID=UPI003C6C0589